MSDANEAEAFYDAVPYEESDDDNEINPDLDQDSDEDYEFEDVSDIQGIDDVEMDPSAWVLAKLNKEKKILRWLFIILIFKNSERWLSK